MIIINDPDGLRPYKFIEMINNKLLLLYLYYYSFVIVHFT